MLADRGSHHRDRILCPELEEPTIDDQRVDVCRGSRHLVYNFSHCLKYRGPTARLSHHAVTYADVPRDFDVSAALRRSNQTP